MAGAPESVVMAVSVVGNASISSLSWDVTSVNKRPTRLPESIFVSFNPKVSTSGWSLQASKPCKP